MIAPILFCLAGAAPWLLYAEPWGQAGGMSIGHVPRVLNTLLMELNLHWIPIPVAAMGVFLSFRRALGQERLIWIFIVACIGFQSVVIAFNQGFFFRYSAPLAPALAILGAGAVLYVVERHRMLGGAFLILLCCTNWLHLASAPFPAVLENHHFESPLYRFFQEISHNYVNRTEAFLLVLKKLVPGEDVILTSNDPEFPLIFHSNLQVVDLRHGYRLDRPPDLISFEPISGATWNRPKGIPPEAAGQYERITLQLPASPYGGSRPDPHHRESLTAKKTRPFTVLRRLPDTSSGSSRKSPRRWWTR